MGALSDDGRDDSQPWTPVAPAPNPWYARWAVDTWLVSRKIGDTIVNFYYAPPGFRDSPVLAIFKTEREACKAAEKANADESTNHRRNSFNEHR